MIAILAVAAMHWLLVNDIHLNPFDGSNRVPYQADANPYLLDSSIAQMRKAVPDAAVIVIGGDLLAHRFPSLARAAHRNPYVSARETIAGIAARFQRAYPNAQFIIALGNNDDPCGDYRSETGGTYLRDLAYIFGPLVNRHDSSPTFVADFQRGAYYRVKLPNGPNVVVVNSVLWSIVYRGSCQARSFDPGSAEMQWLSQMLATGENVVVMHVPPGFDPESTTATHRVLAVPFLSPRFDSQVRSIFERDRAHVPFALGAHMHRYDFRVPGGVPMLIGSSVSPIYRNSPAFYALDVAGSELRDVVPYTYDYESQSWVARPSFDRTYGTTSFSRADLVAVSARIASDPQLRATWNEDYDVWSARMGDVSDHRWQTFVCAQTLFGGAYGTCAGTTKRSITALAGALGAVAVVVVIVVLLVRRRAIRRL